MFLAHSNLFQDSNLLAGDPSYQSRNQFQESDRAFVAEVSLGASKEVPRVLIGSFGYMTLTRPSRA